MASILKDAKQRFVGLNENPTTNQRLPQYPMQSMSEQSTTGSVGQSFGKVIGGMTGGGIGLAGLAGLSKQLADSAAERERETTKLEFGLKEQSELRKIRISEAQRKIEDIKSEIQEWEKSPQSINKGAEIEKRRQSLQAAQRELDQLLK